jgi:hypothetical protein
MDDATAAPTRGARSRDDLPAAPSATPAALLGTDEEHAEAVLDDLVTEALGRHPDPGTTAVDSVPHALGSPATAGVHRVHGRDTAGAPWSLFCKVLQHVRHWSGLQQMPPPAAQHFSDTFPWRSELELWDPRVLASLPRGLRAPRLHRLVELPDDRVAVWQEDVAERPLAWDDADYARAAHLLGRWNARSTTDEVLAVSELPPGFALRMYAERAVPARGLAPLADEVLWSHPWLAGDQDVAAALLRLGEEIPALLDRLDDFTQALPHGDASPQNLLAPADDPDGLVAIDVSFRSPHALGFDLGQLLVGLVHSDVVPAGRLPGIAAAAVPAYVDGLAAEGVHETRAAVSEAFATSVLLRSGFDGFLYGEIDGARAGDPPTPAFRQRVDLARFLVDLYERTGVSPPRRRG